MARVLLEAVLLALIVAALVLLTRRANALPCPRLAVAAKAPTDASWRAMHVGTEENRTEVLVVLQSPDGALWERRVCDVIDNRDPDYDKHLFNAIEDARSRATLLNSLRDE